jgi:hypothetical protein
MIVLLRYRLPKWGRQTLLEGKAKRFQITTPSWKGRRRHINYPEIQE